MAKEKKSMLESKKLFWTVFVLLIGVFCLRFIGLDKDLPPYGVGGYNPTDEGVYASIGLNLYNYGSISPEVQVTEDISVVPYSAYHIRSNIVENVLVYYGLKLFGDNYFGFRAPMVFVSLINFLLILGIAWELIKKYGKGKATDRWLLIAVELFYAVSFPYLISSRVVEPTLVRMTFALIAYYVFVTCKDIGKKYFFTGLIITLSLQFAYVTNIFFYIPIFVCGCLEGVASGMKAFWKSAISCVLGCVLALLAGAVYYHAIWGSNFVSNTLSIFNDFSNLDGYVTSAKNGLKAFVAGVLDFFGANAFLFSMPLLFGFMMLAPWTVRRIVKTSNTDLTYAFVSVVGLFLQTLFTNDYIFRKAFLIVPFVIFSVMVYVLDSQPEAENAEMKFKKSSIIIYDTLVVLLMLLIVWYRFFTNRVGTAHDFTMVMKAALIVASFMGIFAVGLLMYSRGTGFSSIRSFVYVSIAAMLALNLYAGASYVWCYNSYTEKTLMEALKENPEQTVFGAYSYGFTLYNDINPVILMNDEQDKVVEAIPDEFVFIDTSTDNADYVRSYLDDNMFAKIRYTGVQKVEMPRAWMIDGKQIKFALYGIGLKHNVLLEDSIEMMREDDNPFNTDNQSLYCTVAAEKYVIDQNYEEKSKGLPIEDKYLLMLQQNDELDLLYRKYGLTDDDVKAIANKEYSESDIVMIYGGTREPYYGNVYADIKGNVEYPIFGTVYGSIYGDVNAIVYGDVKGDVYGDVKDNVYGEIKGTVYGDGKANPEYQ